MTYINSAFNNSFRFIDIEKIQKKLIYVIDDFFAKQYNANKVRYSDIQTFVEKYITLFINLTNEST